MKKLVLAAAMMLMALCGSAQEIIKTGYNIGPLPAVAFDADKGFEYGAILQLFNYGDGHNYPNYDSKLYLEGAMYTKGSKLVQVRYDNKVLIPNVRWSSALRMNWDKAYDFYGFNGYESIYDYQTVAEGADETTSVPIYTPYYRYGRNEFLFKSDFLGNIGKHFQWEAGIFANYFQLSGIDYESINKGKDDVKKFTGSTLFDVYKNSGVITEDEADGGLASGLRAGFVYDSRDKEGAPSRGIWAEGHVTAALPGISETPYYRYSLTWRQYLPLVKRDILTFAYRLNYEGNIGDSAPFYALSYMQVMGEKSDLEGMGGYNTTRGLMRTRVIGLDMATYNAELRLRFARFSMLNQNIALGLNFFSDGTMVTRDIDLSYLHPAYRNLEKDAMHITAGAGFRFIMNENFIVAVDYGMPISHFQKDSLVYNQDGNGALYINLGYLF